MLRAERTQYSSLARTSVSWLWLATSPKHPSRDARSYELDKSIEGWIEGRLGVR
jgi:hypothetical protein